MKKEIFNYLRKITIIALSSLMLSACGGEKQIDPNKDIYMSIAEKYAFQKPTVELSLNPDVYLFMIENGIQIFNVTDGTVGYKKIPACYMSEDGKFMRIEHDLNVDGVMNNLYLYTVSNPDFNHCPDKVFAFIPTSEFVSDEYLQQESDYFDNLKLQEEQK